MYITDHLNHSSICEKRTNCDCLIWKCSSDSFAHWLSSSVVYSGLDLMYSACMWWRNISGASHRRTGISSCSECRFVCVFSFVWVSVCTSRHKPLHFNDPRRLHSITSHEIFRALPLAALVYFTKSSTIVNKMKAVISRYLVMKD